MAEQELTVDLMNEELRKISVEHGYCLCIHPMMNMINFTGLTCAWCSQPMTDDAYGLEARAIRTAAIVAAFPWAARKNVAGL